MAGVYVHVPFCHAKCAYCDFYSVARPDAAEAFVDAACTEFDRRIGELGSDRIKTLYFGGGTPSILPPQLFRRLATHIGIGDTEEFTIEVNPEDVNATMTDVWIECGVNRVSIGVQSLNDAELNSVNRRHDSKGALDAISQLQKSGIDNISADLIYGLPGQTPATWLDSLTRLLDSGISHISAYCLSYEEGTLLTRRRDRGIITEASDELIEELYSILCEKTAEAGFEHYEISNFALPGRRSLHNSNYWRALPYLGIGPGAHSLDCNGLRRFNPPDIRNYNRSGGNICMEDPESETDRLNDLIMISLRTAAGLDTRLLPTDAREYVMQNARAWLSKGTLVADGCMLRIPQQSWLLCDAVVRDLLLEN